MSTAASSTMQNQRTDYFAIFGLPRKLWIEMSALEQKFLQMSWKLHPDIFVNASEEERDLSLKRSSELNDAYRTLRDPVGHGRIIDEDRDEIAAGGLLGKRAVAHARHERIAMYDFDPVGAENELTFFAVDGDGFFGQRYAESGAHHEPAEQLQLGALWHFERL